jgi:leader peptidase (prepilin peptidase)/N-methyltransferase
VTALLLTLCGIAGLAIGSFLNVVIWRVPRGESVAYPASACPKCEHPIRARDNVPVLSWLLLGGRCRDCAAPISVRYPAVEAVTGVLFAGAGYLVGVSWLLPAALYLVAISVALTLIDIDVRRLPDSIVLPSYVVAAALLIPAGLAVGDRGALVRAGIGACAMVMLYGLIFVAGALIMGQRAMGLGDVKLAGVLGMYLGFLGWKELATGVFLAFLIGGLVGIGFVLAGRRRVKVPFGPYMIAGAWLGILIGPALADWYLKVALIA